MRKARWTIAAASAALAFGAVSGTAVQADPAQYPTNGRLVFSAVDGDTGTVQIFSVTGHGKGLRQLTQPSGPDVWNECPSWSPNGKRILFDNADRSDDTLPQLYRMRGDGSRARLIGSTTRYAACPVASPSQNLIAYLTYPKSGNAQIGIMKSRGTGARVLLKAKGANLYGPSFSPNGRLLAYERVVFGQNGIQSADVYVYDMMTGSKTNLTSGRPAQFGSPSWDPRGDAILATRGARNVVRIDLNDLTTKRVVKSPKNTWVTSPVYAPHRNKIAYLTCEGDCGDPDITGIGTLWTAKPNGKKARAIVATEGAIQPADKVSWGVRP
ncbi:MAG: hypothetical protein U0990_07520 [Candidatus Nanopelagicales bacterium]|nr:hypothetical protein [Candidatus Nanopelagicales bacterium]MDZ4249923.1 hypothetical protein [Candidatus Nanopelagicales bacterium]